jgi:hypothetical protein
MCALAIDGATRRVDALTFAVADPVCSPMQQSTLVHALEGDTATLVTESPDSQ